MATIKDMSNLTPKERRDLGITDPTEEQAAKMLMERRQKMASGVANLFSKRKA